MAGVVAGRTWRSTTPEAIETELAALWRELSGQSGQGIVARAVMSNLVVYRERIGAPAADFEAITAGLPLDEVAARHPSRVILLDHERGHPSARAPFAAGVGVTTFGPPQARYGVEQIAVQSNCSEDSLPSIVRRLLRGHVPTSVWWTEDVSGVPPIAAIVDMGRQLVYDSRAWRDVRRGVLALVPLIGRGHRLDLADLNWRRLAPLRQALVHAVGAVEPAALVGLREADVRIVHRPGDVALAWLLAGWLRARLGWAPTLSPRLEEARRGDDVLSIEVGGPPAELTGTLDRHRVLVTHRGGPAPFTVGVPNEGQADAVAAELRNLSHDVSLHDTIGALVHTFSGA